MTKSATDNARTRPAPLEARAKTYIKKQKPDSRLLTGPVSNGVKKARDIRIAIVGSDFQKSVTDNLEKNCIETLVGSGVRKGRITTVRVPGSLEIPLAVLLLAKKKKFDAIIAFGAIHKGKTYHFQQVADECIRGCMSVSLAYEIPVIYEVLAVYDIRDAYERATRKKENRGIEAALSALAMVAVIRALREKKI